MIHTTVGPSAESQHSSAPAFSTLPPPASQTIPDEATGVNNHQLQLVSEIGLEQRPQNISHEITCFLLFSDKIGRNGSGIPPEGNKENPQKMLQTNQTNIF